MEFLFIFLIMLNFFLATALIMGTAAKRRVRQSRANVLVLDESRRKRQREGRQ
ncbi:MAG: hypothetical protein AAFN09_14695 [Pseudomonadota bacterium]